MCRNVSDTAIFLQALAGYDPLDPASVDTPVPQYAESLSTTQNIRVGVPRAFFYDRLEPDVSSALETALGTLAASTVRVRDVTLPAVADVLSLLEVEAYGYHAQFLERVPNLYQPAVRKRIEAGGKTPLAVYMQQRRRIEELRRQVAEVFETVDVLITPTSRTLPFTVDEASKRDNGVIAVEPTLSNTRPFNIFGLPTISIPCGVSRAGLPIGMQITAAAWQEARVLAVARAYERKTEWHTLTPPPFDQAPV